MNKEKEATLTPPDAEQKDSTLSIHGHDRIDPYFWMRLSDEQKNAETPDEQTQKVLDYLTAENTYSKEVMKETESFQEDLFNEIVGKIKQTDESVPYKNNGYWYYVRYEEGKEYPIYCRKKGSLEGKEEILINANERAEGKEYYSLGGLSISPDNKIVAFSEDTVSRRIYTVRFKNLETGEIYSDELENTTGGGAWAKDNSTFFYTTKNSVSLLSEKIWSHKLNTPATEDLLKYEEKDPSYYISVGKSKSGEYLFVTCNSTLNSQVFILQADEPEGDFQSFIERETEHEYGVEHFQDKFYILTNWSAKNFRLMETSIHSTAKENWKEVIPHRENTMIGDFEIFENHMVIEERSNALTNLKIINQTDQSFHYLEFDEEAYTVYASVNREFKTDVLRFGYTSLSTPNSTFDYDMNTRKKELKKQREVVGGHDPKDYEVERVFFDARDGTKVPLSIVYKKGTKKSAETPLYLYSYGSYGSSSDPYFSSTRLSLLDRGFIYVIAHIRGGQEMGRHWYEDGKMFKKKNTFNDFVDAAKYLIDENYTSSNHLYANGGSAGGLLMGAIVNMNPELFNGIVADVPFVDVVSTMLDESIPLTTNEFDEWGNPKNEDSYQYMLSYSPYDNVKKQNYPNMLITTGYFDSQVQYWEPAKWIAKLRDFHQGEEKIMLKTNMEVGHGGASGRFEVYHEVAFEYAFILKLEGIKK